MALSPAWVPRNSRSPRARPSGRRIEMLQQTDRGGAKAQTPRAVVKGLVDSEHRLFASAAVHIYALLLIEKFAREALGRRSRWV